eukprot:GILI01005130.1.p1 GENE.GILI01005130.1~~GILI01005130.1.p1  ORF type:complete len:501 (+),score=192.52 GILI01005130.1:92-1594(+)
MDDKVLQTVNAEGHIEDSGAFAKQNNVEHQEVVNVLKSLEGQMIISTTVNEHKSWVLTDEALSYVSNGTPEAQVYNAVHPESGTPMAEIESSLGELAKIGFAQAMKEKWVRLDKTDKKVYRQAASIVDATRDVLVQVQEQGRNAEALEASMGKQALDNLKKRKLVAQQVYKTFRVAKGPQFSLTRHKAVADLTHEMIVSGSWKSTEFKSLNFNADGKDPAGGHLHPLLKVRAQFRTILLEMGFAEMPTNNFVESSFWNFDSLFQPQQHPARDSHDTFFLSDPAQTLTWPEDYVARVKKMHEEGGEGSIGWRYDWSTDEAKKNLLRTHTTAVSSRMLYQLAQDTKATGTFVPKKYFSIDRVFRNEALDATHLAEFHQVEGLIADRNLSLSDLIGTISTFFARLGITNLRFKPAYNPYTEPSMEIFGYHPLLKRWVEVGNSGIFRPEMLLPMGLPEDVTVIAWGLSLERPTMIQYNCSNIRDLFGHKVDLHGIKVNPICRYD